MATKKTSIYIDADVDLALAEFAAREGLTKAEFIRRQLRAAVSRPARPRISTAVFSVDAPAWAQDLDHELRVHLERDDEDSRQPADAQRVA